MDEFFSPMIRTVNRNLLKYSAGQAIFCPVCSDVADAKSWVLVSHGERSKGLCTRCWDSAIATKPIPASVEVLDGRVLFARPKRVQKVAA